jgi:serine protease
MATPHVTRVVSLIFLVDPSLTQAQVLSFLLSTARPFPNGSSCTTSFFCSDIVDVAEAVAASFALTVSKIGNGSGTVASSPTGINCG